MEKIYKNYYLTATDKNGVCICDGKTKSGMSWLKNVITLRDNGYFVSCTSAEERLNVLLTIIYGCDKRVARNYIVSILFIISMVLCYFKDNDKHTVLKAGIAIWAIILIGWCINFILDNHYKMDKETIKVSKVLSNFDDALEKGKIDKSIKEAATLEIKDLYKMSLEQRKTYQKEIAVVLGGIGAIVGSATFLKFLGL